MKTVGLDGNQYTWKLADHNRPHSQYHIDAHAIIIEQFPTIQILEEVPITLSHNHTLYLDFYLPLHKTAIEVHGEQHYKFIQHFHGTKTGFLRQLSCDRDKKEWCDLNSIKLIIFSCLEKKDEWKRKLR